ncbi:ribonucleases P/MRP protein subunit POP1-domain-containing protein [Stachybotrys elegans]|uniref:Ribonucleases P/MRP protein subunit POP1-domain-containing protein n=1 Tax=Stachybotrys elegans TaxID=80388 RepID=A0A8K0WKN7_9HYPO|nr:ribonucleases P/MRP protein subunit POP1-domain-containing protein [Stachybotrys elegans]
MPPKPSGGPSGPANKRQKTGDANSKPNGRSDNFNANNQKRSRLVAARTIPAQPAHAALKDGELDLQAFVAAHEFEIRSLEQSMATSKASASTRAFQQVPRDLRRRTASHNPKRVPRRLRTRARREMAEDNTPTVEARSRRPRTTRAQIRAETSRRLRILATRKQKKRLEQAKAAGKDPSAVQDPGVVGRTPRPKIRRDALNDPPKPAPKYRKRQISKTWLPTHLWHAKRARMTEPSNPLWRFAIPLTPNEKIYRPTHRAQGHRGAVLWDMTYMSTIGVFGNPAGLERVLRRIGVSADSCWNARGADWRKGTRSWTGNLSRDTSQSRRQICPATILWNPSSTEPESDTPQRSVQRQVMIRIHPAAFLEVFRELLRLSKMENPRVFIEDLRFEIGSIEVTGPASTETLMGVLTPYSGPQGEINKHARLFQSLKGLTNPASLPVNSVLGFSIQDPRLRHPPRRIEWPDDEQAEMSLLDTISKWPAHEELKPHDIYDRNLRHKASCLPSQKAINRRKSATAPGKFLAPTSLDPPIPIALLATRKGIGGQAQGTWTLLAPWKCILPLWYSLVHVPLTSGGNPRFAGLDEQMQVAFERGASWFPADYAWTDAGAQWELDQRARRKRDWEKRPKSKRPEWQSLDLGAGRKGEVGDGLACDWEFLFGLARPGALQASPQGESQDDADAMDVDEPSPAPEVEPHATSLHLLRHVSKATYNTLLSPDASPCSIPNAVINVRITIAGRGTVGPCARIYRLPTSPVTVPASSEVEVPLSIPHPDATPPTLPHDLRAQWLTRLHSPPSSQPKSTAASLAAFLDVDARKQLLAQDLTTQPADPDWPGAAHPNQRSIGGCHPLVPDAADLIGFVTSGSFNLSLGRGSAIGSLALDKILPGVRGDPQGGHVCIVRDAGQNVGWVARWEVI